MEVFIRPVQPGDQPAVQALDAIVEPTGLKITILRVDPALRRYRIGRQF